MERDGTSDIQTSTHATEEGSADPGATERVEHNPIGHNQMSGMQYEAKVPYLFVQMQMVDTPDIVP